MTDLRTLERDSIRSFVQSAADDGYLSGRVLDYGCGKQPYRDIVEVAGGEYQGYDRADFPASVTDDDIGLGDPWWDDPEEWGFGALLCTQVLQYVPDESEMLEEFRYYLREQHGALVLTYPTHWPEVEPGDLQRFTKAGMERLLTEAGFAIIRHQRRAEIRCLGETFALGYGVIARV